MNVEISNTTIEAIIDPTVIEIAVAVYPIEVTTETTTIEIQPEISIIEVELTTLEINIEPVVNTIEVSMLGLPLTSKGLYEMLKTQLIAGTNITLTLNETENTITINASGGGGTTFYIRVSGNKLQTSTDGGTTWLDLTTFIASETDPIFSNWLLTDPLVYFLTKLQADLLYASIIHNHSISEVIELQDALDDKADTDLSNTDISTLTEETTPVTGMIMFIQLADGTVKKIDYSNVGGGGGHAILDKDGNPVTVRANLKFYQELSDNGSDTTNVLPKFKTAYFNAIYDNGNSGAAKTIDWNNGQYQKLTITANTVLTFTDIASAIYRVELTLIQDGTGGFTVTFPANVKWFMYPGFVYAIGTANQQQIITLSFDGTNYRSQCTFWTTI